MQNTCLRWAFAYNKRHSQFIMKQSDAFSPEIVQELDARRQIWLQAVDGISDADLQHAAAAAEWDGNRLDFTNEQILMELRVRLCKQYYMPTSGESPEVFVLKRAAQIAQTMCAEAPSPVSASRAWLEQNV